MSSRTEGKQISITGADEARANATTGNEAGAGHQITGSQYADAGAAKVVAYCTHAVLSGPAVTNIESSRLDELVVTSTIPLRGDATKCGKIRQLSIAGLLAESIRRINNDDPRIPAQR